MWKIIKQSVEKLQIEKETFILWMKWEFYIEFATDRFGPYEYKFERVDTYYNDWLKDRWSVMFPLKEKKFDNTEIFIERDWIVIGIWKRWGLTKDERRFVDLINIRTEKKYRIFTDEISLIVLYKDYRWWFRWWSDDNLSSDNHLNKSSDKSLFQSSDNHLNISSDNSLLLINFNDNGVWKTLKIDAQTMEVLEEKKEKLYAFFKIIYNETENKWYRLEYIPANPKLPNTDERKFQNWWFIMNPIDIKWKPVKWDRKERTVELDNGKIVDVWEESVR